MLVAAAYNEFDVRGSSGPPTPRIISEIRKRDSAFATPLLRPRLSGDLLVRRGFENKWWPRRVTVLGGQLHVSAASRQSCAASTLKPDQVNPEPTTCAGQALRLPLRQLSLQAGPLPNSVSLCKGHQVLITLQTPNEKLFDLWVKTIAIELIRQTPLYDIKYLDILTLADCWKRKEYYKDCNFNSITTELDKCNACSSTESENARDIEKKCSIKPSIINDINRVNEDSNIDVEDLKRKCQNSESYVPVKQKLVLFESLCRLGRKVRSSEDVSYKVEIGTKRARSLHDLSHIQTHIAVREICKYFENKSDQQNTKSAPSVDQTNGTGNVIKQDCDSPITNVQRLVYRNKFYNSVT